VAYRDLYNVLGVSRGASQDEIKKAYRALAKQWHPDRTGGDEAAAQRFKDITLAYRTLSDADERARYDRLGPLYTPDGKPPRPEDLEETVQGLVGRFFGRGKPPRGEDLRYTLTVTLEEVAAGATRTLTVPRKARCGTCGGDGADPDGGKQVCDVCNGTGRSKGRLIRATCYHCDGAGFTITRACPTCGGDGVVATEDRVQVRIPPGVASGQKLKLAGKGDAPRGPGEEGDLYVVVNVVEHDLFRRRGADLLVDLPLTFVEIALGADVDVPTLDGRTTIRVPAGTPPGRIFRLSGRGLPQVGGGPRGDIHLQVQVEVPEALGASQREALAAWADALPPEAHPDRRAFDDAVRARE
jgi:molecular chaperone DnaJ